MTSEIKHKQILNTIRYWHRLEHFYPYKLDSQNHKKIKSFSLSNLESFLRVFDNVDEGCYIRSLHIYLGIFETDSALAIIDRKLGNPRFKSSSDEKSCFAYINVDANLNVDIRTFKISTFPWAISRINDGKIKFDNWEDDFNFFFMSLLNMVRSYSNPFSDKEICYDFLNKLKNHFAEKVSWEIDFDTYSWMRIDRVIAPLKESLDKNDDSIDDNADDAIHNDDLLENDIVDKEISKNALLNSFYISDLEKIIKSLKNKAFEDINPVFAEYVLHHSDIRINVENNIKELFNIFSPNHLPIGRWPSDYNLRAMQQVAVNIFSSSELKKSNVFSVNGPPGTGKTTLLKDVISDIIVKKALLLSDLSSPEDAFENKIFKVIYLSNKNKQYECEIKKLKNEFAEHAIIVASNNNAAVQNITKELPKIDSVTQKYNKLSEYDYYADVANNYYQFKSWGLPTAILGSKKNCMNFFKKTWMGKNISLPDIHRNNKTTKNLNNWQKQKEKFKYIYSELNKELEKAHSIYELIIRLDELNRDIKCLDENYQKAIINTKNKNKEKLILENELLKTSTELLDIDSELSQFKFPNILKAISNLPYIQKIEIFKKYNTMIKTQKLCSNSILKLKNTIQILINDLFLTEEEIILICQRKESKNNEIQNINLEINRYKEYNKISILPTEEYLKSLTHSELVQKEKAQKTVPWMYEKLNLLREQLFLEAMQLHKQFFLSSQTAFNNIDTLNKFILGFDKQVTIIDDEGNGYSKRTVYEFLLQSLFYVVPVVSTTFASIGRFLSDVKENSIGYLLIDEAGQAVPQSAAGAIWKSKNVIVVGDPLQIEPVITLHDKVLHLTKREFIPNDPYFIGSKESSVQSLADYANSYGSYRKNRLKLSNEDEELWIGSPIVVHGRCYKTIFDISNKIAYDEKMIYDTKVNLSECEAFWIDTKGESDSSGKCHYVQSHAFEAYSIFKIEFKRYLELMHNNKCNGTFDLFVITPFREVKNNLTKFFTNSFSSDFDFFLQNINISQEQLKYTFNGWLYSSVGTIHTFQGKEASVVIICLGIDSVNPTKYALEWASERPNLLNVAITRAKKRLYIIGDKDIWTNNEVFKTTYEMLLSSSPTVHYNDFCEKRETLVTDDSESFDIFNPIYEWNSSWMEKMKEAITLAVENSINKNDFVGKLKVLGYEVKWTTERKRIIFTSAEGNKCSDTILGKAYGKTELNKMFGNNYKNKDKKEIESNFDLLAKK